jgi:hypothetical protein
MSPMMLIERMVKVSRVPQTVPRHSPMPAKRHAIPTVSMSGNDQFPKDRNASRASGLSRHSDSRGPPGKRSNARTRAHIIAPKAKNAASQGWHRDLCAGPAVSATLSIARSYILPESNRVRHVRSDSRKIVAARALTPTALQSFLFENRRQNQ